MDIRYVGTNIIANYIICYGILYHVYMIGAGNMYDVVTFSHIDISITDRTCHTICICTQCDISDRWFIFLFYVGSTSWKRTTEVENQMFGLKDL